jgi:hypothetical protein
VAWDEVTNTLYLSDLGGRLWQFRLTRDERVAHEMSNQRTRQRPAPGKEETKSDLRKE